MSQHKVNSATLRCVRTRWFWEPISHRITYEGLSRKISSTGKVHDKFLLFCHYYHNEISHFKLRIIYWNIYYLKRKKIRQTGINEMFMYKMSSIYKTNPFHFLTALFNSWHALTNCLKKYLWWLYIDFQHVEIWNIKEVTTV